MTIPARLARRVLLLGACAVLPIVAAAAGPKAWASPQSLSDAVSPAAAQPIVISQLPKLSQPAESPWSARSARSPQLAWSPQLARSAQLAQLARSAGVGWLRLAHLSPNTPAVDVYLYSFGDAHAQVVLRHVSYGTVSPYMSVASGQYTVAMRPVGASATSTPVLSTSVAVTAKRAYTVAGMGPATGLRLQIFKDTLGTPRGRALVRVIQASLRQHHVSVTMGSRVITREQAFATVTSYDAVSPGTWRVHALGASGAAKASRRVRVAADSIHTLLVLDESSHLKIVDLEDAAGSRVIPTAAVATGLGGAAPRTGSPQALWLTMIAAGSVLLVTAARRTWRAAHAGVYQVRDHRRRRVRDAGAVVGDPAVPAR